MKAYFTASIVGKKYHLAKYERILSLFRAKGVTVTADHIINTTEDKIRFESKGERLQFLKKLEHWILEADFVIVEASFPSISVGYEISLALHRGKPVLVLYSEGDPPSLITGNEDDKLVCERYSMEPLPVIVNDFINYVQGTNDTRFTFFITPEISAHLEKKAKRDKIPKSVYLRNLIKEDMK